jgi:O-antigen ligase
MRFGAVRVDTSTSDRLRSWQEAAQYWKSYPIWGMGVTGGPFMDAMYPRVLTETGTVGLVAFFILIGAVFRMGWAAYRQAKDPFPQGVAMGFLLGLVGLLVHAIGANSFIIVRIMEPFWLVAALVARINVIDQSARPVDTAAVSDQVGGMRSGRRTGAPVLRDFGVGRTMKR